MSPRLTLCSVVVLAALTLVVSGCGGDESASTTTETTAASADRSGSVSDPAAGDSGAGDEDTSSADLAPECAALREAFTSLDLRAMTASFGDGENPGPQFQKFADTLALAQENAPEAIADDLALMTDRYQQLAESADSVDWEGIRNGDPAASAEARELLQGFTSDDLSGAGERVSEWLTEHCIPS